MLNDPEHFNWRSEVVEIGSLNFSRRVWPADDDYGQRSPLDYGFQLTPRKVRFRPAGMRLQCNIRTRYKIRIRGQWREIQTRRNIKIQSRIQVVTTEVIGGQ